MTEFLFRRGAKYSFRRRYPREVAKLVGKTEYVKALGTADQKEAARLARMTSVEFDRICSDVLKNAREGAYTPPSEIVDPTPPVAPENAVKAVFDEIPSIIRTITERMVLAQAENPHNWRTEYDYTKRALKAHLAGIMPKEIPQIHPVHARWALDALEAVAKGKPLEYEIPSTAMPQIASNEPDLVLLSENVLAIAIEDYGRHVSARRLTAVKSCVHAAIKTPCSRSQAIRQIEDWCATELSRELAPNTVGTWASGICEVLGHVPGWAKIRLQKSGRLSKLKGSSRALKTARDSITVNDVRRIMVEFPKHQPRGGSYLHATALICALYGIRPGELLGTGAEALVQRSDVMGKRRLVFAIGLNGAKNETSIRDLPVSDELKPIFELALRLGKCSEETRRTRVDRLRVLVKSAYGDKTGNVTTYTLRHTFTDIARNRGYDDADLAPILGHSNGANRVTGSYGSFAPLDKMSEILAAVQDSLFPDGLTKFAPRSTHSTSTKI